MQFDLDYSLETNEPEALYGKQEVNQELNRAWEIIENTDKSLFLTGKAGTGKTTFLKKLRENSSKNLLVLTPTGIAAINASGTTIHSFFQFPLSPYLPGQGFVSGERKFFKISKKKKDLIQSISLLVIDEISMVRPDLLDAIDQRLRKIRQSPRPFGGIQLLLIGDLRQLPPVIKDDEWELLKTHYSSPYFYDSIALKNLGYQIVELTTVYRQSDRQFIEMLNAIRDGNIKQETLDVLNRKCLIKSPINEDGFIRLTTHNHHCARINESRLNSLPGESFEYEAEVDGNFPESAYPAESRLKLKVGAQVIFVKNDIGEERKFYNGLIGTVVSLSSEKIRVKIPATDKVVDVVPMEWENNGFIKNETTGKIEQTVEGLFRQFPLQLAWAITIHKSQGLTFNKAIIDATNSFAPGQTYVALSRCRNLDGLRLERPLTLQSVIIDREINNFIKGKNNESQTENNLEELKKEYFYNSFLDLFNFNAIKDTFSKFEGDAFSQGDFMLEDVPSDLLYCRGILNKNILQVANKFLSSYSKDKLLSNKESVIPQLQERIKKGSKYFIEKLQEFDFYIDMIPIGLKFNKALKTSYDNLRFEIGLKEILFQTFSKEDFSTLLYEETKEKALLSLREKQKKKYENINRNRRSDKPVKEKKPKGYSIEETYRLYLEGNNIEEIAKIRALKEVTIANHIINLIKSGRIKKEEIIDPEIYNKVQNILPTLITVPFPEKLEIINNELNKNIPNYLFCIYKDPDLI